MRWNGIKVADKGEGRKILCMEKSEEKYNKTSFMLQSAEFKYVAFGSERLTEVGIMNVRAY